MSEKGHKKKVPEQHLKLLSAREKRGTVVFERQFHDHNGEYMNATLQDIHNLEGEYCEENKAEGIHLTGPRSLHNQGHLHLKKADFFFPQETIH